MKGYKFFILAILVGGFLTACENNPSGQPTNTLPQQEEPCDETDSVVDIDGEEEPEVLEDFCR